MVTSKDKTNEVILGNISNLGLVTESSDSIFYNKYEEGIVKVKGNKDKLIKYLANVYIESIKCENDFLNDLIKGDEKDGKSGNTKSV